MVNESGALAEATFIRPRLDFDSILYEREASEHLTNTQPSQFIYYTSHTASKQL